ncbi:MAG: NAD(+) kinase [Erysipelotrichaceae bacterium]
MNYKIIQKPDLQIEHIIAKVSLTLEQHGFIYSDSNPNLILCIGGDGTVLHAVHEHLEQLDHVFFIAIHKGTLGFFTDYTIDEVDCFLQDITTKQGVIHASSLLEATLQQEQECAVYYALNEMRIENVIRTQEINVKIDQEFFETIHGSGVCLSTQLGSTAYNRSLRGAVVDSGMELMQLCEITAIHHNKFHSLGVPYIMHKDRVVEFTSSDYSNALFLYDHKYLPIAPNATIQITTSNKKVRFLRFKDYSYLERLKNLY